MVGQANEGPEVLADPQHAEMTTHTVLSKLRELIVTGKIAPDTRLRAEALAEQLDVSRTPVRSALALLSAEGLVSYSVNRGYTVRPVTIRDIFDSIDVRATLEALACQQSVERGWSEQDLDQLANLSRQLRAIVDKGEWSETIEREWYEINRLFHRLIDRAAQNAVLRNTIRMTLIYPVLGDVARICPSVAAHVPQRYRQLSATVPDHIRESQLDHERVLEAIRAGDGIEAARLMSAHVLATKARLHAIATLR
ncbi:MAG TPA: GntR family transcriptional regulator [Steroidobacter sp.]|uniref:GntR family transcriptional regulator n=1 Tax=Steroidobacter sp. TaxID=1978227 RepID=UPI002EDAC608